MAAAGCGSGWAGHVASDALPVRRYAASFSSRHLLPLSAIPWFPPPSSTTSAAPLSLSRMLSAPPNGVAASSVAWKSSADERSVFLTSGAARGSVFQNAHGALYQALFQVMKGASACVRHMSARQVSQSFGQAESRHCTAVYTL